jgi:DNA polymerase I
VSAEQDGSSSGIVIFARGEDGNRYRHYHRFKQYCYTESEPSIPDPNFAAKIGSVRPGHESIFGTKLFRVELASPKDLYEFRKFIPTHEGDIKFSDRGLIDLGIKDGYHYDDRLRSFEPADSQDIPMRVWCIDIEIINSPGIPTWKQPYYPVVCIVVYDSYTKQYYSFDMKQGTEVSMFERFAKKMQEDEPDVITGWNVDFDVSYILGRMEHLRKYFSQTLSPVRKAYCLESRGLDGKPQFTNMKIHGRVIFDGLKAYQKYKNPSGKLASYNLKSVAKMELGADWEDFGAQTTQIWLKDPDKIIEYCKHDVENTWGIIEKNKLIELYSAICAISGCTLDRSMSKEAITDSYLLRIAGDEVLPSRDTQKHKQEKAEADLKGGLVLEPDTGMQEGIACFDAAGLYPSIMIGFNISPECLDKENGIHRVEGDNGFTYAFRSKTEKVGIIPRVCMDFKSIRGHSKARKFKAAKEFGEKSREYELAHQFDAAVKTVMNGVYGVVGTPSFRLFNLDCANAITAVGRNVIDGLSKTLSNASLPTVYGDTDSVFVKVSTLENVPRAKSVIENFLGENLLKWGVDADAIEVAFEKYFERLLFKRREVKKNVWKPVKKKYVGYMTYSDDHPCDTLYIRGFETRRSDTSKILNKTMMSFFETVVQRNDIEEGIKLIKDLKEDFKTLDPLEFAVPRAMHKEVENSPWYRGMKYAQKHCGYTFDEDTSPRLIWIKEVRGDHEPTNAFCIQDGMRVPDWLIIDYDLMFEKVIKKKFYPLLHELNKDWDKIFNGKTELDEWFV